MSSHAELLDHSCPHCAEENGFVAPTDLTVDLGGVVLGDCLWYKLAHAWLYNDFQNTLGYTKQSDSVQGVLYRHGISIVLRDGTLYACEWMVPSHGMRV